MFSAFLYSFPFPWVLIRTWHTLFLIIGVVLVGSFDIEKNRGIENRCEGVIKMMDVRFKLVVKELRA